MPYPHLSIYIFHFQATD